MQNNGNGEGTTSPSPPTTEEAIEAAAFVADALERLRSITSSLIHVKSVIRNNLSTALAAVPLGQAADLISTCKFDFEGIEEEMKGIKESLSYCLEVTIPERFKAEDIKSFNTDRFRVTRTSRVFASILPDTLPDAYQWLRDNEYDSIIKETVNASTLSATAKELMENGKELPDDLFRVHLKDGTSITKKR